MKNKKQIKKQIQFYQSEIARCNQLCELHNDNPYTMQAKIDIAYSNERIPECAKYMSALQWVLQDD